MGLAAYSVDARFTYVDANGVPTGNGIGVLNAVKLIVNTQEADKHQQISHKRDNPGQASDEIFFPKPTLLEISIDDLSDKEVMAWAFNGVAVGYSQDSATVTDEEHIGNVGQWTQLANRQISSLVVKDVATGAITYVAGTDYLLDPVSGQVQILKGGAITDGENLKYAYTAAALTGTTIQGGTRPNIYVRVDGEGKSLSDGSPMHLLVRRASLSSAGQNDMVGGNPLVSELKGTALLVGSFPAVQIDRDIVAS
jgi:hypothetical protein